MTQFHNPDEFPFEAFVERIVSEYFRNDGYETLEKIPFLDLHFKSSTSDDEWKIECKGKTSSIGVDFNTGLGQILKRMTDETSTFAIALPDIISFRKQTEQIPKKVRERLNLHWIWVTEKGDVKIESP